MPAASRPPTLEQIVIRSSRERSAGDDIGGANVARKIQHRSAARRALDSANSRGASTCCRKPVAALTGRANDDEPCRDAHHVKQATKQRPSLLTNAHPVSGRRNGASDEVTPSTT
jgi:hypothetical protein